MISFSHIHFFVECRYFASKYVYIFFLNMYRLVLIDLFKSILAVCTLYKATIYLTIVVEEVRLLAELGVVRFGECLVISPMMGSAIMVEGEIFVGTVINFSCAVIGKGEFIVYYYQSGVWSFCWIRTRQVVTPSISKSFDLDNAIWRKQTKQK